MSVIDGGTDSLSRQPMSENDPLADILDAINIFYTSQPQAASEEACCCGLEMD
jgi:hypothetical protein